MRRNLAHKFCLAISDSVMLFGRFARARGTSMFARAFNNELPRGLSSFAGFSTLYMKLSELPIQGFAEQFTSTLTICGGTLIAPAEADLEGATEEEAALAEMIADVLSRKFSVMPTSWLALSIKNSGD